MSVTFAQAASLLCVGGFVGIILYRPIIKPIREAIKEFNENKRLDKKAETPNKETRPVPTKTSLRLVK